MAEKKGDMGTGHGGPSPVDASKSEVGNPPGGIMKAPPETKIAVQGPEFGKHNSKGM